MLPTQSILADANQTFSVTDEKGRVLVVRSRTPLDTLRLFKAAGPVLSLNEPWLAMASLASSVYVIDNVPVPSPMNEAQIEALIDRLGDDGLTAVANATNAREANSITAAQVGN